MSKHNPESPKNAFSRKMSSNCEKKSCRRCSRLDSVSSWRREKQFQSTLDGWEDVSNVLFFPRDIFRIHLLLDWIAGRGPRSFKTEIVKNIHTAPDNLRNIGFTSFKWCRGPVGREKKKTSDCFTKDSCRFQMRHQKPQQQKKIGIVGTRRYCLLRYRLRFHKAHGNGIRSIRKSPTTTTILCSGYFLHALIFFSRSSRIARNITSSVHVYSQVSSWVQMGKNWNDGKN